MIIDCAPGKLLCLALLLSATSGVAQDTNHASIAVQIIGGPGVNLTVACATPDPDGNPAHCDIPVNAPIGSLVLTVTGIETSPGTVTFSLSGDVTQTFSLMSYANGACLSGQCAQLYTQAALTAGPYSLILQGVGQ